MIINFNDHGKKGTNEWKISVLRFFGKNNKGIIYEMLIY